MTGLSKGHLGRIPGLNIRLMQEERRDKQDSAYVLSSRTLLVPQCGNPESI